MLCAAAAADDDDDPDLLEDLGSYNISIGEEDGASATEDNDVQSLHGGGGGSSGSVF